MNDTTLLFATYFASADYKMYRYVTEYVEKFTGIPAFLLNGEQLDDFSQGYIDAGFVAAPDYAYLAGQEPNPVECIATAILQETSQAEGQVANSKSRLKIMVRRESYCHTIADLQENTFSYCFRGHTSYRESSTLKETLLACDACLLSLRVKSAMETCSYVQALRMVMDGEVDAAIIEASVLDLILRNSVSLARGLREIATYNVSKAANIVVSTRLNMHIKEGLREAFRTIHQEPFFAQRLQEGSIERFQVLETENRVAERLEETVLASKRGVAMEVCMI